jgi:hypothetical protein
MIRLFGFLPHNWRGGLICSGELSGDLRCALRE